VILVAALAWGLTFTSFAQSKSVKSVMNNTSIIVLTGIAQGTNISYIYAGSSKSNFAGVITGTLNGQIQKFYCIDLLHEVDPGYKDMCKMRKPNPMRKSHKAFIYKEI
jgi:hypothetical protein